MDRINQTQPTDIHRSPSKKARKEEKFTAQSKLIWLLSACAAFIFGVLIALIYTEFMAGSNEEQLIMTSSFLIAFLASILAEEQIRRIQFSIYGFVGGAAIGIFVSLVTNNDKIVISGFAGAASGTFSGWIVSMLLCLWIYKFETGRVILTYLSSGFDEIRKEIRLNAKLRNEIRQIDIVRSFNQRLARRVEKQMTEIINMPKSVHRKRISRLIISEWLASSIYTLDFLYRLTEDPSYDFRHRASIVLFSNKDGVCAGKYWIYECGEQRRYNLNQRFDEESPAFKVLKEEITSPTFFTLDKSVSSMFFRINDFSILSVDWLNNFGEDHPYVLAARSLFENEICPSIKKLLNDWEYNS